MYCRPPNLSKQETNYSCALPCSDLEFGSCDFFNYYCALDRTCRPSCAGDNANCAFLEPQYELSAFCGTAETAKLGDHVVENECYIGLCTDSTVCDFQFQTCSSTTGFCENVACTEENVNTICPHENMFCVSEVCHSCDAIHSCSNLAENDVQPLECDKSNTGACIPISCDPTASDIFEECESGICNSTTNTCAYCVLDSECGSKIYECY